MKYKGIYSHLNELKTEVTKRYLNEEHPEICLNYILDYSKDLERAFLALEEIVTYNKEDEINEIIDKLFTLSKIANFLPLIIALWLKYKEDRPRIKRILSLIEITNFRIFAIGKKRQDTGESLLYALAKDVHTNPKLTYNSVEESLREFVKKYQDDKDFMINLTAENFYNRIDSKDIKYLLYEYEKNLKRGIASILPMLRSRGSWRRLVSISAMCCLSFAHPTNLWEIRSCGQMRLSKRFTESVKSMRSLSTTIWTQFLQTYVRRKQKAAEKS
jgi:hypothetical protein